MKTALTNLIKFLAFAGVGVTILYLVYQQQEANYLAKCAADGTAEADCSLMDKLIADFRGLNYWWILMVMVTFSLSNLSRAIRWGMLLQPLSHRPRLVNTYATVIIGYLANMFLPRIGEVVRGATLSRYEKIPVEKVMGTIVLDRLMDVLFLLLFVGLAFVLEFDVLRGFLEENLPEDFSWYRFFQSPLFLGLFAVGLLGLGLLYAFRQRVQQSAFYRKITDLLRGFAEGLRTIRQLEKPGLILLHSANVWLMYYLMNYLCFFAFAPTAHLSPGAGQMVLIIGAYGIVLTSPGGKGSYHRLAIQDLALYGIDSDDAFSFANIAYVTIQIVYNFLIGVLCFLLIGWLNRRYVPPVTPQNDSNEALATN